MFVVTFDVGRMVVGTFDTYEEADEWNNGNEDGRVVELDDPGSVQ